MIWKSKTCTEPFDSAAQDKLRRSIQNINWLVVAKCWNGVRSKDGIVSAGELVPASSLRIFLPP